MLLNTKIPPIPSSYLLTPLYFMKKSAKVPRKLPSEPFGRFKTFLKPYGNMYGSCIFWGRVCNLLF
jgi:hypothetical protein